MLRIGVVGVGGMGQAHCDALKKLETCDFCAVCDVREEQVKQVAEKFGVQGFTDLQALLNEVDGIVVATPPRLHREVVERAAAQGVHVFCEKPLAETLEDCDAMVQACDAGGVTFMVGQVLRFYPVHELGMKMLRDGEIGDLIYIETDYSHAYRARQRSTSWYGACPGLLENGVHKADLINWFGGQAEWVAGARGSFSGHADWEDWSLTLIRFQSGVMGYLRWGGLFGARGTSETILDGTKGSLRLDMRANVVSRRLLGEKEWTEFKPEPTEDPVVRELRHFVECAEQGTTPLVDGREGRRAVELVLASYRSADEESKVKLPM